MIAGTWVTLGIAGERSIANIEFNPPSYTEMAEIKIIIAEAAK